MTLVRVAAREVEYEGGDTCAKGGGSSSRKQMAFSEKVAGEFMEVTAPYGCGPWLFGEPLDFGLQIMAYWVPVVGSREVARSWPFSSPAGAARFMLPRRPEAEAQDADGDNSNPPPTAPTSC